MRVVMNKIAGTYWVEDFVCTFVFNILGSINILKEKFQLFCTYLTLLDTDNFFPKASLPFFIYNTPEVSCCSILSLVPCVVLLDVCLGNCFVLLVYLQFWLGPSSPHYFCGNKWHGSFFYHLLTVEYACPLLSEALSLLWELWQIPYEKHLIYKYFSMLHWNSFQKEKNKRQTNKKPHNSVFQVCYKPAIN